MKNLIKIENKEKPTTTDRTVRRVDSETWRQLKIIAATHNMTLSQALGLVVNAFKLK